MADLKIDIASVFSGKKAFADASKSTLGLNKQVNTLAKSFLGLFTAQKLARAGFNAAKAFAADDKAARVLSRSLDNLGLSFADPAVKTFIADLEKQFGVLDDQLRPAFQRLLTTTGDVAKSQQLLRTALNLSAASGVDVVTVSGDLSKAYVGQTRALAKYGIGLTQAQLKAMSFEEVQTRINDLFAGQAENAVNTYAGSFDKLNVAVANANETIGKGLIDSLSILGGGGTSGFDNVIRKINAASNAMASFARGTATAFKVLDTVLNLQFTRLPGIFAKPASKATITPAVQAELNKAAAEKAALKRSKEQSALLAKNTKAIKEQTALQKAGTLFDAEQTAIVAALKGKISEDERKRLELQLALLTGNTKEASKLSGEIGKAQGLSEGLVNFLKDLPDADNPFAGWKTYLDAIEAQVKRIAMGGAGGAGAGAGAGGDTSNLGSIGFGDMSDFIPANPSKSAFSSGTTVVVNVAGSVITEGELIDVVRNGLINSSLSGAGSLVARRTGTFATL
jgi:hypothetical protein